MNMKCHVHVLLVPCKRKCHFWSSVSTYICIYSYTDNTVKYTYVFLTWAYSMRNHSFLVCLCRQCVYTVPVCASSRRLITLHVKCICKKLLNKPCHINLPFFCMGFTISMNIFIALAIKYTTNTSRVMLYLAFIL